MNNKKYIYCLFFYCVTSINVIQAAAITFQAPLDFHAPTQSLWGQNSSFASFEKSDSFGSSRLGFNYKVKSSTGTVKADYQGNLSVNYQDRWYSPGSRAINLGFSGDRNGGLIDTDLGASINVGYFAKIPIPFFPDKKISGSLYKKDYTLDIEKEFTPSLNKRG